MRLLSMLRSRMPLRKTISSDLSQSSTTNSSFSQAGEDRIIQFLANCLRISPLRYLDIGGYHPTELSNTYLFYLKGGSGVCVEPNPQKAAEFSRLRPRDTLLRVGICPDGSTTGKFFVMDADYLCTFDKAEAHRMRDEEGHKILSTVDLPMLHIMDVIEEHFLQKAPDLISLDVEGFDFAIVNSFDFSKCRPSIWCVETILYRRTTGGVKLSGVSDVLLANGYKLYADTHINSIFVDSSKLQ